MRTPREKPRRAKKLLAGIPGLLPKYRSGEIDAARFFEGTRRDFDRMAQRLIAGWDLPSAVSVDDVAQVLRVEVMLAIEDWDPSRCELSRFAIFRACGNAKTWLHRQRGADKSQQGAQPSRYPLLLLDAVEREERETLLDRLGRTEATQEQEVCEAERGAIARRVAEELGVSVDDLTRILVSENKHEAHVKRRELLRKQARRIASEGLSRAPAASTAA